MRTVQLVEPVTMCFPEREKAAVMRLSGAAGSMFRNSTWSASRFRRRRRGAGYGSCGGYGRLLRG